MSNDLHSIITSLNQSEKRYFKRFLKRYSDNNNSSNYAKLFDYLSKAEKYDKNELLKNCPFISASQLANIKTRLYNYILLSLRIYNSKSFAYLKINIYQYLIDYEILRTKGLYKQAWKIILKAEKISEKYEYFDLLLEILDKKLYLTSVRIKSKSAKKEIQEIVLKKKQIKERLNYLEKLSDIKSEIYDIFKKEGRTLRDVGLLEKISERLDLLYRKNLDLKNCFKINYLFNINSSSIYQLTGEFEKAQHRQNIIDDLFKQDIKLIKNQFEYFQKNIVGIIINSNMLGNYDKAMKTINRYNDILKYFPDDERIELAIFESTFYFELEIYLHKFEFEKAVNLIHENLSLIESHDENLHNVNQQSKRYRIALCYFGAGDYNASLDWINKIINYEIFNYRKDVLVSVQLLNILIHLELNNTRYLKHAIKKTSEYLKKIGRWLVPEQMLIHHVEQIISEPMRKDELLKVLALKLTKHFKTNKLDSYFICYFDLVKWINFNVKQSQIEN